MWSCARAAYRGARSPGPNGWPTPTRRTFSRKRRIVRTASGIENAGAPKDPGVKSPSLGLYSPPTVLGHNLGASGTEPGPPCLAVAPVLTTVVVTVPVIPGVRVVPRIRRCYGSCAGNQHKANQDKH